LELPHYLVAVSVSLIALQLQLLVIFDELSVNLKLLYNFWIIIIVINFLGLLCERLQELLSLFCVIFLSNAYYLTESFKLAVNYFLHHVLLPHFLRLLKSLLGEEMQPNHVMAFQYRIADFLKELDLPVKQVNVQLLDRLQLALIISLNMLPSLPNPEMAKHRVYQVLNEGEKVKILRPY
jgi:hypothetical protein